MSRATREGEELSQQDFAAKLGLSKSHLCDIEKGRKVVSPERAAQFARVLGYPVRLYAGKIDLVFDPAQVALRPERRKPFNNNE